MFRFDYGDPLWSVTQSSLSCIPSESTREPSPTESFKRIQIGDVGYVRRGRFHLLFSAGSPLGERELGVDVPPTFKQLIVGPIDRTDPLLPGCLSTSSIRETGVGLGASMCPIP